MSATTLPVKTLPTATVDIDGTAVEVRGLSRAESMHFSLGFREEALPDVSLEERADRAETYLLATAVGVSIEEAAEWRSMTDAETVGLVVDKALELSGLTNGKDADPQ